MFLFSELFLHLVAAISALTAALISLRNAFRIQSLKVDVNHRLSQLIEASHAQGRQAERDSMKEK